MINTQFESSKRINSIRRSLLQSIELGSNSRRSLNLSRSSSTQRRPNYHHAANSRVLSKMGKTGHRTVTTVAGSQQFSTYQQKAASRAGNQASIDSLTELQFLLPRTVEKEKSRKGMMSFNTMKNKMMGKKDRGLKKASKKKFATRDAIVGSRIAEESKGPGVGSLMARYRQADKKFMNRLNNAKEAKIEKFDKVEKTEKVGIRELLSLSSESSESLASIEENQLGSPSQQYQQKKVIEAKLLVNGGTKASSSEDDDWVALMKSCRVKEPIRRPNAITDSFFADLDL